MRPSRNRAFAQHLQAAYGVSQRRSCEVIRFSRSACRYRSTASPQEPLRLRIREIAQTRVGWGYRRVHTMLAREGWRVNHKRVYRLYGEEGLAMRRKPPRHFMLDRWGGRADLARPPRPPVCGRQPGVPVGG